MISLVLSDLTERSGERNSDTDPGELFGFGRNGRWHWCSYVKNWQQPQNRLLGKFQDLQIGPYQKWRVFSISP